MEAYKRPRVSEVRDQKPGHKQNSSFSLMSVRSESSQTQKTSRTQ